MAEVDLTSGGQDRKFMFKDGHFVNRVSGEVIPHDEPVFIMRARDRHALPTLLNYQKMIGDPHHQEAVQERIEEFSKFITDNPDKMKEPGVTRHVVLNRDKEDRV